MTPKSKNRSRGDAAGVDAECSEPTGKPPSATENSEEQELLDPNDSDQALDQLRGQTTLHAKPPRLEDEGQSGG